MKRIYAGVDVTWREGNTRHRKRFSGPEEADRFFGRLAWQQATGKGGIRKVRIRPRFERAE